MELEERPKGESVENTPFLKLVVVSCLFLKDRRSKVPKAVFRPTIFICCHHTLSLRVEELNMNLLPSAVTHRHGGVYASHGRPVYRTVSSQTGQHGTDRVRFELVTLMSETSESVIFLFLINVST